MSAASISSRSSVRLPSYATFLSVTVIRWILARSISRFMDCRLLPSGSPAAESWTPGTWSPWARLQSRSRADQCSVPGGLGSSPAENQVVEESHPSDAGRHEQQRLAVDLSQRDEILLVDEGEVVDLDERLGLEHRAGRGQDPLAPALTLRDGAPGG